MGLKLTKPLVIFDVESTGLDIVKDRIVQLSYIKIFPNGKEERGNSLVNPEMPIPAESQQVHGISDDMVAGKPTFKMLAHKFLDVFTGADIAGFNSNRFDIPLLVQEFNRAGVPFDATRCNFVDVQVIFHKREKRDLEAAYRFYCGKEMENHHDAMCDTETTYEVFKAQLEHYDDLSGKSVEELSREFSAHNRNVDLAGRFIYNEQGKEVFNFGKYRGRLVEDVRATDSGYYGWMINGDFAEDTKKVLTRIRLRMNGVKSKESTRKSLFD